MPCVVKVAPAIASERQRGVASLSPIDSGRRLSLEEENSEGMIPVVLGEVKNTKKKSTDANVRTSVREHRTNTTMTKTSTLAVGSCILVGTTGATRP